MPPRDIQIRGLSNSESVVVYLRKNHWTSGFGTDNTEHVRETLSPRREFTLGRTAVTTGATGVAWQAEEKKKITKT